MQVALIGPDAADPGALRSGLKTAGYSAVSRVIHVGFGALPSDVAGQDNVFITLPRAENRHALVTAAFRLDDVSRAYRLFVAQFSPLADVLDGQAARDDEALVARTLLIHAFRRVVLRDPGLPADLLPPDWQGDAARTLAARIYGQVVGPSELFLDRTGRNETGPLPPPMAGFHSRFAS